MLTGGIIAAGHGSRFKEQGFKVTKPLIRVGGVELLGRTVNQFLKAGINRIRVIFRSSNCNECTSYLTENFPNTDFQIICKDTKTSAESFLTLLEQGDRDERLLIATVDSIYQGDAFSRFLKKANGMGADPVILGVTKFVDDEKPLFVTIDPDDGETITQIGGKEGDAVTCGVYLIPARATAFAQGQSFNALRMFLGHLFSSGSPFKAIDMGTVVDVDRPEDIETAETFLAESRI